MAILKTITTTTPIVDADGVNVFGWLRVRPNAPFEYTDGGAISVTDSIIECQLVDGAIYAVGGVVSADLSLAPNTGASNSPETYYIVDLELNGTTDRQYWRIDSATGGAGSVDVEYVDVPRVPGPDAGSNDTLSAHLAASNPHQQYVLRSDTVAHGGTTTGAASDGLGKIPRCNTSTGDLDPSVIPSNSTITGATVTLADAGAYFTADNAEAALQQLGPFVERSTRYVTWLCADDVFGSTGNKNSSGNLGAPMKRIGNVVNGTTASATEAAVSKIATGVYRIYCPTSVTTADCDLVIQPQTPGVTWLVSAATSTYWNVSFDEVDQSIVGPPSVTSKDTDFSFTILYMRG